MIYMKNRRYLVLYGFIIVFGLLSCNIINECSAASEATSDQYGTIDLLGGDYIAQNNIWGATTAQTISVSDTNVCAFTVSQSSHNQATVASYPSIFKGKRWALSTDGWQSLPINKIKTATYSWSVDSYRPSGKYNVAAEAWFLASTDTTGGYAGGGELMIWLDANEGMVPAGSKIGEFGTYQVWYFDMGWDYICYYQTGKNSVDVNLMEFINDTLDRGYFEDTWYLHDIEVGFEIMSGGQGLSLTSFSATVNGDSSSNPTNTQSGDSDSDSIFAPFSNPDNLPALGITAGTSFLIGAILISLLKRK